LCADPGARTHIDDVFYLNSTGLNFKAMVYFALVLATMDLFFLLLQKCLTNNDRFNVLYKERSFL
jgi:hypothetical protein